MVSWHISTINTGETCNSGLFYVLQDTYMYLNNLCLYSFVPGVHSSGKIFQDLGGVQLDPTGCTHCGSYCLNPEQSHCYSKNGRPIFSTSPHKPNIAYWVAETNHWNLFLPHWLMNYAGTLSHALSYHLLSKIQQLCSTLQNFSEFTRQRTRLCLCITVLYSMYYLSTMYYLPTPFFGRKLCGRVFIYIVSAHPLPRTVLETTTAGKWQIFHM